MPLFKTIHHNPDTQILVWKITETFGQLRAEVQLTEKNAQRLLGMKSVPHQCGFLAVRKLVQEAGYTDFDVWYDEYGKPHLKDGRHISISHSHECAVIIISNENTGIDLELQRDKITLIAYKFIDCEFEFLDASDKNEYLHQLTVIWGAKEAIFKIRNEAGISFKDHIRINAFHVSQKQTTAILDFESKRIEYDIFFEEIENFTLVYAFEKVVSKQ